VFWGNIEYCAGGTNNGHIQEGSVRLYGPFDCDNEGTLYLPYMPKFHFYIIFGQQVKFHFTRNSVELVTQLNRYVNCHI
jgi:hypothetical protein